MCNPSRTPYDRGAHHPTVQSQGRTTLPRSVERWEHAVSPTTCIISSNELRAPFDTHPGSCHIPAGRRISPLPASAHTRRRSSDPFSRGAVRAQLSARRCGPPSSFILEGSGIFSTGRPPVAEKGPSRVRIRGGDIALLAPVVHILTDTPTLA